MGARCQIQRREVSFGILFGDLSCPSKVNQFMWRACKNILATNYCLKLKKIPMEDA